MSEKGLECLHFSIMNNHCATWEKAVSLARAQQMTEGILYFETVDICNKDEIRNVFKKVKPSI